MASGRSRILTRAARVLAATATVVAAWADTPAARAAPAAPTAKIERTDSHVSGEPGIALFVREVRIAGNDAGVPIVLVHGARVPGVASFDLEVPNGSLAADLAAGGHRVFIMDVRGYGGSTRPAAMDEPADRHPPLVRSDEAVRDLDAVVEWVKRKTGVHKVALFGWATGGHWCGMYAALHPDKVSHLVMLNSLYGGTTAHPLLQGLEDPKRPGHLDPSVGAYGLAPAASLLRPWDASIPTTDKAAWRDPAVADAYVAAALASDPTSQTRTPPSLRAPGGALEDSFYQATGRQLWDASLVQAATLVLRSELDFWSRPEDATRLASHLVHAERSRVVVIPRGTHMVHLDRPENGRKLLLATVLEFLRPS